MSDEILVDPDRKNWDHNGEEPIVCTCRDCGAEGVTRDAVVRWSKEEQKWELSGIFDNADCDDCGETKLDEEPLKNWSFKDALAPKVEANDDDLASAMKVMKLIRGYGVTIYKDHPIAQMFAHQRIKGNTDQLEVVL